MCIRDRYIYIYIITAVYGKNIIILLMYSINSNTCWINTLYIITMLILQLFQLTNVIQHYIFTTTQFSEVTTSELCNFLRNVPATLCTTIGKWRSQTELVKKVWQADTRCCLDSFHYPISSPPTLCSWRGNKPNNCFS